MEIPYKQYGYDIEEGALAQMENAKRLPVAVAAALMPDAHQGYGLPIGGVLAVDNAVIPYAVGMDIACRMKMTVLDLPVSHIAGQGEKLRNALLRETRFGLGAEFKPRERHSHPVMDMDWKVSPVTAARRDKAWAQLGTSGSGNHFVEFGTLTLDAPAVLWSPGVETSRHGGKELPAGVYLALLSHSGSRGVGGAVAQHYSRLAASLHPELKKDLSHLAWLDMDSPEGMEYWAAMRLMGEYASASHRIIHRRIAKHLGAEALADVENHHNFAWKERHHEREVIVHRKGATPAMNGVLGIIPGSMGTPGYVVRGLGGKKALHSASHGAGRRMSRTQAKQRFTARMLKDYMAERQIVLLSAGVDECPLAYKDIDEVMACQRSLVEPLARFDPKIVRMSGANERGED